MKECPNCKTKLKEDWNYCPKCGTLVKNPINIMLKKVKDRIKRGFNVFSPSTGAYELGTDEKKASSRIRKNINKTIELEIDKKWVGNRLKIKAKAPGIKELDDCKISIFGESLEIRGYCGEKRFFKVMEVPEKMEIEKKEIEDNKIKLSLS